MKSYEIFFIVIQIQILWEFLTSVPLIFNYSVDSPFNIQLFLLDTFTCTKSCTEILSWEICFSTEIWRWKLEILVWQQSLGVQFRRKNYDIF